MNSQLVRTVLTSILGGCENKEMALSPLLRPTIEIDGYKHPVLKVRVGKDESLEANIVDDLWATVSLEPHTKGYVDPEVLLAFINAELGK